MPQRKTVRYRILRGLQKLPRAGGRSAMPALQAGSAIQTSRACLELSVALRLIVVGRRIRFNTEPISSAS